jgi:molecular chaperone DnaJ
VVNRVVGSMASKTYYMVLGVSRTESPNGIRAAYRDLAKRLHPDVAGTQATHAFQEITQAYDVLSNPERRQAYNHELSRAEERDTSAVRSRRGPVIRAPVEVLGNPDGIRPSFDETYDRFRWNFTGTGVPKSERLEGLNFEVLLTAEERARGCVVPVGIPVFETCPTCRGTGRHWVFPCVACRERGMIEREEIVHIRVPPETPSGAIFEVPLRGLGIHNFYLRLHIFDQA